MLHNFPYTNFHDLNLDWILDVFKKRVQSVNNTFPDDAGNVNLPTVAGVSSVDLIGADGNGNVETILNAYRIFKDKRILVIGDSISNTNPNWTYYFGNMINPYNAIIVNNAVDGDSFAGQMNNGYSQVASGFDIVIVFLGVNDWQGNWNWTSGDANSLVDATTGMINAIKTNNPDAKYVFLSPIPNLVNDNDKAIPLNVYTGYYQKKFHKAGFQVIDGSAIPDFDPNDTDILYDGLHPGPLGSEKIAHYIINAMITEQSSFSPVTATNRTVNVLDSNNTIVGYVGIELLSNGICSFKSQVNNFEADTVTKDIVQLPNIYATALFNWEVAFNIARQPDYISLDNSTHKLVYHTGTTGTVNISTPSTTFVLEAFQNV